VIKSATFSNHENILVIGAATFSSSTFSYFCSGTADSYTGGSVYVSNLAQENILVIGGASSVSSYSCLYGLFSVFAFSALF